MYFETKTKSIQITESGKDQKVSEHFIMKAVCFTDAETITISNFGENENFEITHVAKSKIAEIINPEESSFWKVTAQFVSVDEQAGKEKKVKEQYLFGANSLDEVKTYVDLWLNDSLITTEILGLVETKIVGVLA
jgi:hypothetical protein